MLKLCQIYSCANGTLGLHLSRAPWDPYPWVSDVQKGSSAHAGGIRSGDTLLELNGCDVLGQKISEIASRIREHWQSGANYITVIVWRNKGNACGDSKHNHTKTNTNSTSTKNNSEDDEDYNDDDDDDDDCDGNAHTVNQRSLQKFATCLQSIAQLLECPVCLEVIKPPGWQCCNGHVLCNNCRSRSVKCPVCRVPLGPRGRCLLSDKLFTLLAESFPCDRASAKDGNKSSEHRTASARPRDLHNRPKRGSVENHQTEQPGEEQIKAKDVKKKVKSLRQQQHQEQEKLDKIEARESGCGKETGEYMSLANEIGELRLANTEEDKLHERKVNVRNLRMHCKTSTHNTRFFHLQRCSRANALQQQQHH